MNKLTKQKKIILLHFEFT